MSKQTITIIGLGRLGKAFSIAFSKAGYKVIHEYKKADKITELGDFVFITTPDSEIVNVSSTIASRFEDMSRKRVIHCSGTLSSDILNKVEEKGAKIGCFHPIKAVSTETDSFEGIYFDLEGDGQLMAELEEMAGNLGSKSIRVTPKEKELLHLSAVIASNYLVTLTEIALKVSNSTTIPQRKLIDALIPLMESSLDNLKSLNPSDALTGPIVRGDVPTVKKHIKLLEKEGELLNLYKKLGLFTLDLIEDDFKDDSVKVQLHDALK